MSEAAIVYSAMNSAASKADNVARKIESYSDEITKKVLNKLNNYGGDWSGNLSDARSGLNAKINSLNSDYNSYKGYATDIRTAVNQCKQTDDDVRETVKNLSSTFKVSHGIRDNVIENYLSYIFTSIGNSNPALRLVSDTLETIGEAGSELMSCLKTWWNYDGGKQLVTGVAVAVLEIAAAVAGIVIAVMTGTGIVMLAAVVAGVIAASNGLMNLANEALAYWTVENDPATARRLNNQNTIQDVLREGTLLNQDSWVNQHVNISRDLATGIDVVNLVCAVISFGDSVVKLTNTIKTWSLNSGGFFKGIKEIGSRIKGMFSDGGIKLVMQNYMESCKLMLENRFTTAGTTSPLKVVKNWLGFAKDLAKNINKEDGVGEYLKTAATNVIFPSLYLGTAYTASVTSSSSYEFTSIDFVNQEYMHASINISTISIKPDFITVDSFSDLIWGKLFDKIIIPSINLSEINTPTINITVPGNLNNLDFQFVLN